MFAVKYGKEDKVRNLLMPILATIASAFMVFAAFYAHGVQPYQAAAEEGRFSFPMLFYLIVFAIIMGVGALFYKKQNNVDTKSSEEK